MCDADFPINISHSNQPFSPRSSGMPHSRSEKMNCLVDQNQTALKQSFKGQGGSSAVLGRAVKDVAHYEKGVIETPREGKEGDI